MTIIDNKPLYPAHEIIRNSPNSIGILIPETGGFTRSIDLVIEFDQLTSKLDACQAVIHHQQKPCKCCEQIPDLVAKLDAATRALEEIANYLKPVAKAELGIHTSGEQDPYYHSWNDGEYFVSMALNNAEQALKLLKEAEEK